MVKKSLTILSGSVILAGLYVTSIYNYLLFHSIVEMFSIVVACGIFIISWNCLRNKENNYLLLLGIAYFFVGSMDFIHTLAYKGMGVFPLSEGSNLATQLWLIARYIESISLCIAPLFLKRKIHVSYAFASYTAFIAVTLLSVYWQIFPESFIEGIGLTRYKKVSELVISLIFFGAVLQLIGKRQRFDPEEFRLLVASILISIGAEIAFIYYVNVYGISNFIGHILKIISFYLIYKAIIKTGLIRPFDILFRDLKQSEETLRDSERRLKRLNETKDRFFSIIAHDLRTPLVSTTTVFQYLIDDYKSLSDSERLKFIEDIEVISTRTIDLLDNLLHWAKSQTGDMLCHPEKLLFHDLLLKATAPMERFARNKNIDLNIKSGHDLWVSADSNMITTVIRNLVSNAIKFSHPDSRVLIEIKKKGKMAEFMIKDTGTGIESDNIEKLFTIETHFTRSGTQREKGSGLGLLLCKNFIEKNGGEIRLESKENEGTTVYFSVPLA